MPYQLEMVPNTTPLADLESHAASQFAVSNHLLCAFGVAIDEGTPVNWIAFDIAPDASGSEVKFVSTGSSAPTGYVHIGDGEFSIGGVTTYVTAYYK